MNPKSSARRLLFVIMDGVGVRSSRFGNAVALARTPNLDELRKSSLYTTLEAHGTAVGMLSDTDLGNSEVGHNAMGAGRIFDQGAKLVQNSIRDGSLFRGAVWQTLIKSIGDRALHLIGLLSDGNVHSHEDHLFAMLREAKKAGVKRVFVHALLDGRDVPEKSADIYAKRLNEVMDSLNDKEFKVQVASGGGRMRVTMDRYEADWQIVERGWNAHVHGLGERTFSSLLEAVQTFHKEGLTDQYCPSFVIADSHGPVGRIADGDGVVCFNFRGDRAIEISRAFTESSFSFFDRGRVPKVYYAGMMQYDGDLLIPEHYLVSPPAIDKTLGEYLAELGLRQFACSETQKFGHVTYFWNGNRSGKFNSKLEDYLEIPSDRIQFDARPEMKAREITNATLERMRQGAFDFARINFANGDMVGHTGNLAAAIRAVETVDAMVGELTKAAKETDTVLLVTADHGNCDEMFEGKEKDFPNWEKALQGEKHPAPKTAHTLSPVPLYIFDPRGSEHYAWADVQRKTLSNLANTALVLMGQTPRSLYLPALIRRVNHG